MIIHKLEKTKTMAWHRKKREKKSVGLGADFVNETKLESSERATPEQHFVILQLCDSS